MSESGKTTSIIKKSYEIAYALCRIAAKIPERPFADALANEGIKILGFAAGEEYNKAEKALSAVEYFIKLGTGVGSIDFANGEVLLGEIALLNEMVAGLLGAPKAEPTDLSGIFTPVKEAVSSPAFNEGISSEVQVQGSSDLSFLDSDIPETDSGNPAIESYNPAIMNTESGNNPAKSGNENSKEIIELIKSGNRHGAILEKIRQSGNCRIKDIHDLLPECSERTLRYDLQSLVEQNLIERIGTGGPGVFYRNRK